MGALYIVSTPIGNLEDITIRAQKTLAFVDLVLCEDTRRTACLTNTKLMRFDEHTEQKLVPQILEMLFHKNIALVSDAGTPLISDPGYRLVTEAIKRGIQVVSIPGPTAAIAALTSSGLPTNRFLFLGYPPEKQSHRIKLFQSLMGNSPFAPSYFKRGSGGVSPYTVIFYCAPHKLRQILEDMNDVLGDIDIVIARELTKMHEEVWRGRISDSQGRSFKGELVLLFSIT